MKSLISLIEYRKKLGYTQEEMAQKLEVSNSYYSKIESGHKNPSFNFINNFIRVYPNVDVNIFFEFKGTISA